MRIGLVCTSFLPMVGGVEWKVHYLAEEYQRRGHDVAVFCARRTAADENAPMPVQPSYAIIRSGGGLRGMARFGVTTWRFRRSILREHRRRKFDVLHAHHLGYSTRFALAAGHAARIPVIATTCGGDIQVLPEVGYGDRLRTHLDRMTRWNLRHVDVVGSISSAIRMELEELGTTARIVDIPNGVPWEDFQVGSRHFLREDLALGDQAVIVLSVGRHTPVKGFEFALKAFGQISGRFPEAHYVLVGRWNDPLKPLIHQLGLERRVSLLPQVPIKRMPDIFHSADVFLSTSWMEGFSQVNAQALACGLPCVLTDAPGNRDAATGGGAILVRTGDAESIAAGLAELVADPNRRLELGRQAHVAGRQYAWGRIAEQYLAVFAEVLDGRRDRAGSSRAAT